MNTLIFNKEMIEQYNKTIEDSLLYKKCSGCSNMNNNIIECKCTDTLKKQYLCNGCSVILKNQKIDIRFQTRQPEYCKQLYCLQCTINN